MTEKNYVEILEYIAEVRRRREAETDKWLIWRG